MNPSSPIIERPARHAAVLLVSVFIIAICGLVYELIVGTLSSYLFGNSVVHFSVTIGLFMSAMGLGAYASRRITRNLLAIWPCFYLAGVMNDFIVILDQPLRVTQDLGWASASWALVVGIPLWLWWRSRAAGSG